MKGKKVKFIIIDDSELDCFIAEKLVRHSGISTDIKTFLQASEALEYIKNNNDSDEACTIILIDILMPLMNGMEFVEEFERLPQYLRERHIIVAFTSSMNKKDKGAMENYESVKFLFDKPLSPEIFPLILEYCHVAG